MPGEFTILAFPDLGVAVSPDGTHIYVTNAMDRGTVAVITRP